jgi:hypothetical protein
VLLTVRIIHLLSVCRSCNQLQIFRPKLVKYLNRILVHLAVVAFVPSKAGMLCEYIVLIIDRVFQYFIILY